MKYVEVTLAIEVDEDSPYAGKPRELRTLLEGALTDEAVLLTLDDCGVDLVSVKIDGYPGSQE